MASPTQWTWTWANSKWQWGTGKPDVLQSMGLQRVRRDLVTRQQQHTVFTLVYDVYTEKAMAPHSSTLAWKIPWTEEPGGLQSMRSLRVGHDWATSLSLFTFMHWRRKWQPTPVFLPGESQGWEPGGLPSMGSHRVGHDWSDLAAAAAAEAAQLVYNIVLVSGI